jgi:hypothetical protein
MVVALFLNDIWQIDFMIYSRFKYQHYQYILNIVDVYSRFAISIPFTNRRMESIVEAFEKVVAELGPPHKITADNEFDTELFRTFSEEHHI